MRILAVTESGWVEDHIIGSLQDDGHQVEVFFYGTEVGEFYGWNGRRRRLEKNRELAAKAEELARGSGLDLIFCYVYDDFLLSETARALQRLGVPLVNYNVDMVGQWYRQTLTARYFSCMLCAQKDNMHLLSRYNPNVYYFPMAGRPKLLDGRATLIPPAPVTFLGTPTSYRVSVLRSLEDSGVPLAVYGKFWKDQRKAEAAGGWQKIVHDSVHYAWPKFRAEGIAGLGRSLRQRALGSPKLRTTSWLSDDVIQGPLPSATLGALFQNSQINLGFTRMMEERADRPGKTQVKLRDFEIPMAGGFYLVEHAAEHATLFRVGKEIETWKSMDDLKDKIEYYLRHPGEREAMALAGRQRARSEHTWSNRFAELFSYFRL